MRVQKLCSLCYNILEGSLLMQPLTSIGVVELELDELASLFHSEEDEVEMGLSLVFPSAISSGTVFSRAIVLVLTSLHSWTSDMRGTTISMSQG